MTGSEAWSIIAPILAAHMQRIPHGEETGKYTGLNLLDEAYVITCGALQRFDKWKQEAERGSTD